MRGRLALWQLRPVPITTHKRLLIQGRLEPPSDVAAYGQSQLRSTVDHLHRRYAWHPRCPFHLSLTRPDAGLRPVPGPRTQITIPNDAWNLCLLSSNNLPIQPSPFLEPPAPIGTTQRPIRRCSHSQAQTVRRNCSLVTSSVHTEYPRTDYGHSQLRMLTSTTPIAVVWHKIKQI